MLRQAGRSSTRDSILGPLLPAFRPPLPSSPLKVYYLVDSSSEDEHQRKQAGARGRDENVSRAKDWWLEEGEPAMGGDVGKRSRLITGMGGNRECTAGLEQHRTSTEHGRTASGDAQSKGWKTRHRRGPPASLSAAQPFARASTDSASSFRRRIMLSRRIGAAARRNVGKATSARCYASVRPPAHQSC